MDLKRSIYRFTAAVLTVSAMLSNMVITSGAAALRENLAVFVYDTPGTFEDDLDVTYDGDKDSGYSATGGIFKSTASLSASVNGSKSRKLEWSAAEYTYKGNSAASVPVITAGKKNPWGDTAYIVAKCSTKGYENIQFSAKVGGSANGPANYKLQYSTNGISYTDVPNGAKTITEDIKKDLSANLFDGISVSGAEDKDTVYFRLITRNTVTISGGLLADKPTKGETAVNDIYITGTSISAAVPKLSVPSASIAGGSEIYGDTEISLSSDMEGASIVYSVNGGAEQVYTAPFKPFEGYAGKTAAVTARAEKSGFDSSDTVSFTYTCTKDRITGFVFTSADDVKYVNGSVRGDAGVYPTGKVSASLNRTDKYVPLYDDEKGAALAIAPDDTYKWHKGGYWQFEICTLGYNDVYISADAFSSRKGPASMQLQYSTDGKSFTDIDTPQTLSVSKFGSFLENKKLPDAAADKEHVFVRFVMNENKRADSTDTAPLFDNESKGNTYINNVIFTGTRTDSLKAPYTAKKSSFFGSRGTIEYVSPDGADMKYSIYDKNGNPVTENEAYTSDGIALAKLAQFNPILNNVFTVRIWAENGGKTSAANTKTYTFKGDVLSAFEFDETSVINAGAVSVDASSGSGSLCMYPNGSTAAELSYHAKSKFLRADASSDNPWTFDTSRNDASNDGFWLIKTSTKGYKNLVLSADMYSTEKGPRDFCINYSTDGKNYTALPDSGARMTGDKVSAYVNIPLPEALYDKDEVFIKIKIDGGETVSGVELTRDTDDTTTKVDENVFGKGGTGINDIEICGTKAVNAIGINTTDTKLQKGKTYYTAFESTEKDACPIVAFYSEGRLLACQTAVSEFTVLPEADTVKLMLWSMPDMLPLTAAAEKSVQQ